MSIRGIVCKKTNTFVYYALFFQYDQNREQERYTYDSCGYLTPQAQAEYGFTRDELNPEYSQQRLIQHNDIYQQGHKLNRLNHHYCSQ